jgi:putative addiction module component (TIGR02574 family)
MRKEEILTSEDENPSTEKKALLDRELEEYKKNPEGGLSWDEVETRLRKISPPII